MSPISAIRDQRSEISNLKSEISDPRSAISNETRSSVLSPPAIRISLLTGGGDKPYALGMAAALTSVGIHVDFVGSDDLSVPELLANPRLNFLNLRGDQREDATPKAKVLRVLRYYARLIWYAAKAKPKLFHILWNNKFQLYDRTVLMLYYKLLGKRVVFTAHNVNAGKRDLNDSWMNRFSLKIQYALSDHVFVHSEAMKLQLVSEFNIADHKVSAIPFGINNTVPNTAISTMTAKQLVGVNGSDKTMLFFGNIAPYKGLEFLICALAEILNTDRSYRLIIAGEVKRCRDYWNDIQLAIAKSGIGNRLIRRIEYIPDEETEIYFKAADVLIVPYVRVFQSCVLFLGYSFGLPAIVADVGTLKEDIIEGETGFVCKARDSFDLATTISRYFASELFRELESQRPKIKQYANERYSWSKVAAITTSVYSILLAK